MTPAVRQVVTVVAAHFEVSAAELLSRNRHRSLALPRQVAYLLCRDGLGMSYPEIGRAFKRDHTTVMSGCAVARELRISTELAILRGHLVRGPARVRARELSRLYEEQTRIAARIAELEAEAGRDNVPMEARP